MIKCPDCAEENIFESLFCEHCGRCLLAPDPAKVHWSTVTHTERPKPREGIDFYDGPVKGNSRLARLERGHQTATPVIAGGLLLLNLLVIFLVAQIMIYLTS